MLADINDRNALAAMIVKSVTNDTRHQTPQCHDVAAITVNSKTSQKPQIRNDCQRYRQVGRSGVSC